MAGIVANAQVPRHSVGLGLYYVSKIQEVKVKSPGFGTKSGLLTFTSYLLAHNLYELFLFLTVSQAGWPLHTEAFG